MPGTQNVGGVQNPRLLAASPEDWAKILSGPGSRSLEEMLLAFLPRQRWFGAKSRLILSVKIADWGMFDGGHSAIALLQVRYEAGDDDYYLLPLNTAFGEAAELMRLENPAAIIGAIAGLQGDGILHDGLFSEDFLSSLLHVIANAGSADTAHGKIQGIPSSIFTALRGDAEGLRPRRSLAEQSNSSIFYGDRFILKLFRRQQPGVNPDAEIGRYLTDHTTFRNIAPFGGSIDYRSGNAAFTLAMLQGLVANQGDGWEWTLQQLDYYYESSGEGTTPSRLGVSLQAAELLGRRTGGLHLALGSATDDEAFTPEPFSLDDPKALREQLAANAARAFDALEANLTRLPDDTKIVAKIALDRQATVFARLNELTSRPMSGLKTRIHGDYHLGQVLRTESDFVILDFEGEPARSLEERRTKQSPLKDVAGMLRSFSYVAFASLLRRTEGAMTLAPLAGVWERAVAAEFLRAYRAAVGESPIIPSDPSEFQSLLDAFVLDKALYELVYELNNRPTWVGIPLEGILSLLA